MAATSRLYITDFIHRLKDAGFTDKQAEVLAKETEILISQVAEDFNKTLFTKLDAKELELRLVKWIIATGAAGILAIVGILKYIN